MIGGIIFILISWLVVMPLWLSISLTIFGGLKILWFIVKIFIKLAQD